MRITSVEVEQGAQAAVGRGEGQRGAQPFERLRRASDRRQHAEHGGWDGSQWADLGEEGVSLGGGGREGTVEHQAPGILERPGGGEVGRRVLAVVVEALPAAYVADGGVGDRDPLEAARNVRRADGRQAGEVPQGHDARELAVAGHGRVAVAAFAHGRQRTCGVEGGVDGVDWGRHGLVDQVRDQANIEVWLGTQVERVEGDDRLERVFVTRTGGTASCLSATSMFIFIGAEPKTDWLDGVVARDERGFVLTGAELQRRKLWSEERDPYLLETSVPGVFAVGDERTSSLKRVAAAVGEGSVAVSFVHQYLQV